MYWHERCCTRQRVRNSSKRKNFANTREIKESWQRTIRIPVLIPRSCASRESLTVHVTVASPISATAVPVHFVAARLPVTRIDTWFCPKTCYYCWRCQLQHTYLVCVPDPAMPALRIHIPKQTISRFDLEIRSRNFTHNHLPGQFDCQTTSLKWVEPL